VERNVGRYKIVVAMVFKQVVGGDKNASTTDNNDSAYDSSYCSCTYESRQNTHRKRKCINYNNWHNNSSSDFILWRFLGLEERKQNEI